MWRTFIKNSDAKILVNNHAQEVQSLLGKPNKIMLNIQHLIKSRSLKIYHKNWQRSATVEDILYIDKVYLLCEKNYSGGGDQVVVCMTPEEILQDMPTLEEVKKYCSIRVEMALNQRPGDSDDWQLKYAENNKNWQD